MYKNTLYVPGSRELIAQLVTDYEAALNSESPRRLIATGGRDRKTKIIETELFNQIKRYVQQGN